MFFARNTEGASLRTQQGDFMARTFGSIALSRNILLREFVRKSIHITIAIIPFLASWNYEVTLAMMAFGVLFYVANESARVEGRRDSPLSRVTEIAARPAEDGFVWGPVTLVFGAMLALIFFPLPAATVAIYALAFGDGLASLAGKIWGKQSQWKIGKKTFVGSLACFLAVAVSSYGVLQSFLAALLMATVATLLEMIPFRDADNVVIPLGTGFVATLMLAFFL